MAASRQIVLDCIARGDAVYGLTTGLGSRASETISKQQIEEFSIATLRGRAHSLGDPLPVEVVRGAMLIRLNSMLSGASGGSPDVS